MAGYVVKGAAVAARVAGSDRYYERGVVLPAGVENIDHLIAVGLVSVVEVADMPPAAGQGSVAFDPSKHTTEEVLAELESVADDADEVARIRQAERDGKNRQTLTKLWDKADAEPVTTEQN